MAKKNLKCWDYFGVGRRSKKIQNCLYIVSDDSLNTAYSIYQHLNCEHILTQGFHFQYFISQKYTCSRRYIYMYIYMDDHMDLQFFKRWKKIFINIGKGKKWGSD